MFLEELYSRAERSLESQGDYSLFAFSSIDSDRVQFERYPSSMMFGASTFSDVLYALRPKFAIQASSPYIRAVIESRPWPADEVFLDYGYLVPVRIVENAVPDLYHVASPAFVRADMSLVLWGEDDELLLSDWTEIIYRIQNQFGFVMPGSTLMAGPSEHPHTEGNNTLPPLNDLPMLSLVAGSNTTSPNQAFSELYPQPPWPSMVFESLDFGSLQISPDNALSSIEGSPLTADLGSVSPHPIHLLGLSLGEEEDTSALDFTTFISDEEGSLVMSNDSGSTVLHHPPGPGPAPSATGSSSFRRHSVGEASASAVRAIGQKTKRSIGEEDVYSSLPSITVEGVDRRIASGTRAFKRSRSGIVETTTATSAPALLSVPLPDVEQHARDDSEKSGSVDGDSSQLLTNFPSPVLSSLASASSASLSPSPSPVASRARAGASGGQRRTRRRGGGGGPARPKRSPCPHCPRTFSRIQDAQRHITTSCNASPTKTGVECPECHQVLSRIDAAQRHWRQHENPTCAPPEWAMRAS